MNKKIIIISLMVSAISLITVSYYLFTVKYPNYQKDFIKKEIVKANKDKLSIQKNTEGDIEKVIGIIEEYKDDILKVTVNNDIMIEVLITNNTEILFLVQVPEKLTTKTVSMHEYYLDKKNFSSVLQPGNYIEIFCENTRLGDIPKATQIILDEVYYTK